MRKNAEKPDFMNTRTVGVWAELKTGIFWEAKNQYLYGILRKIGHGMDFCCSFNSLFGRIIDVLRSQSCFLTV